MKNIITITFLLILFTGCTQSTLVETGQQTIKSIVVTPTNEWNQVPKMFSIAGLPTWTIDGVSLNSLSFISDIKDGETLIKNSNNKEYPIYTSDMLPTELAELFESSIAIAFQGKVTEPGKLRPIKIGGHHGFEYNFEFVADDELLRKGYVAAAIKDEKLHLIFYQAAKLHYFDNNLESVKLLVSTATIK